jgi:hypothetical protein
MTIVAPDLLIPTAGALPVGYTVAPGRPLIVETNGRGCTLAVLNGSAEARPVDGYGAVTGSETPITPGAPMTLAAAGRWRITYDGDGGQSSPLFFS